MKPIGSCAICQRCLGSDAFVLVLLCSLTVQLNSWVPVQFDNAWNGNWLSFCAAREVVNAMLADANKGTLLVHNGDISYAQ